VVDVLAEPGEGERRSMSTSGARRAQRNGALALRSVRDEIQPISYDELMRMTEIWVDAALRLEPKDLRMMERLVNRQTGKAGAADAAAPSSALSA
jgi:DSF synthase